LRWERKTIVPLVITYEFIWVREKILCGLNKFLLLGHRTIQEYLNVGIEEQKRGGVKSAIM